MMNLGTLDLRRVNRELSLVSQLFTIHLPIPYRSLFNSFLSFTNIDLSCT